MPTLGVHVLHLPMRVRFRGLTTREVVLLEGPHGWGEFSPFVEYDDEESVRWLQSGLEAVAGDWPAPVRSEVPLNATVPAVPAADVAGVLARFPGCTTAKVKVAEKGQSLADDVERVAAVRDAGLAVRVDANGGWSVEEAVRAVRALGDLEYVEQPCATVEELALVRRRVDVRVAADESVRRADDPLRVARAEAADVLVLKVAPLGGVRAALRIAEQCGLPVVVSSALDSSVGIAAGVALAAALPEMPFACGLGTVGLLAADVVDTAFTPVLRPGAVVPLPDRLAELAAPEERQEWWRARLARVEGLLP